jgi:hypothetical protein
MSGADISGFKLATFVDYAVSPSGIVLAEIIGLVLVAILSAYLYYRHWQRISHEIEPPAERDWIGKGFDPSGIAPKIQTVRKNYLAEKHRPETHFRRGLLAFARRAVSHLAFFEERPRAGDHGSNVPR